MTLADLRVERAFAAAPDRVYAAWTQPEVLRRWWAAGPDWHAAAADVDVRVGGRYRLAMAAPDGSVHAVRGEYLVVEPPTLLVHTWAWEDVEGATTTLVRVEFRAAPGGGTTVVITHTGFPSEADRDQHGVGWGGCLDNLAARVLGAEVSR